MDSVFRDEPVSSRVSAFRAAAKFALSQGDPLVILFRYANAAGSKDYFVAKSMTDFDQLVAQATAKTSVTIFFRSGFLFDGIASDDTAIQLSNMLPLVYEENEGIDIVCVDAEETCLDDDSYVYLQTSDQINEWVAQNHGREILAGTLAVWRENCDDVITVYVPDDDGVVRPGAY